MNIEHLIRSHFGPSPYVRCTFDTPTAKASGILLSMRRLAQPDRDPVV